MSIEDDEKNPTLSARRKLIEAGIGNVKAYYLVKWVQDKTPRPDFNQGMTLEEVIVLMESVGIDIDELRHHSWPDLRF